MSADSYSGSDGSSATATTRADIEATRARMGDTIEELGVRLNPSRLKQQAKDKGEKKAPERSAKRDGKEPAKPGAEPAAAAAD